MFIVGVIADGGGDFSTVVELDVESTVLFVVDSVTIGCALAQPKCMIIKIIRMIFVYIMLHLCVQSHFLFINLTCSTGQLYSRLCPPISTTMNLNQKLKGAVLGNGPSRDLYDYSADVVIGCNIPSEGYSVDATIITDVEVIWVLKNNPELINCPLIVSNQAYQKMLELRIDDQFEIMERFPTKDWHTSGHYAALYLSKYIECGTIDIWGCDSYFIDSAVSTTDKIVPKSGDLYFKQWRTAWDGIFAGYPSVEFNMKRA